MIYRCFHSMPNKKNKRILNSFRWATKQDELEDEGDTPQVINPFLKVEREDDDDDNVVPVSEDVLGLN